MNTRVFPIAAFATAFALVLALVAGASLVSAQATPDQEGDTEIPPPHPAHIHAGTCEELGEVVYPLNDLQPIALEATPEISPAAAPGSTPVSDVREVVPDSDTRVDVSLDELVEGEYAINVHESAEDIETYIACGNITGTPDEGMLTIQLEELSDSGLTGIANLMENNDGTTSVSVTLFDRRDDIPGTPVATPSS